MIKLIIGNCFDTTCEIIAHGVNTKGSFGSGFAGQIAKKWPRVREAYLQKYHTEGWQLGDIQLVFSTENSQLPLIANVATQKNFGYDGALYVDYQAIKDGLTKVVKYAYQNKMSLAMPKIGAGLAGGNWLVIFNIINKLCLAYPDVAVEIYSLDSWD